MDDKNKTGNMIKDTNILKARVGENKLEQRELDKKVESVMVVVTPPSK